MAEQTATSNSSSDEMISELDSWRQVHRTLVNAVIVAEEAVAIQKAQRRYWLQEIAANLDKEGTSMHQSTSIWKRPVTIKRHPAKRATTKKRKKASANESSSSPSAKPAAKKKPRKKKSADGAPKPLARPAKPKKRAAPAVRSSPENISPGPSTESVGDDEDSAELVVAEEVAKVASDEDTEAEDASDSMSVSEYAQGSDADTHAGQPPAADSQQHAQWGEAHNLQMMAAVAFGANPASSYPSTTPTMHHPAHPQAPPPHYNPHYYHHSYPPHHYYHPPPHHHQAQQYQPQRTYASLEDVNSEDDDSDQDKF